MARINGMAKFGGEFVHYKQKCAGVQPQQDQGEPSG